jgi:hypothetical protein
MHWFWRGAIAFIFSVSCVSILGIAIMAMHFAKVLPLSSWWIQMIFDLTALATSPTTGILCWTYVTRKWPPPHERETRCRKCGYILRGISEPKCSECGEVI